MGQKFTRYKGIGTRRINPVPGGILADWRFSGGLSKTLYDQSGNGVHLSVGDLELNSLNLTNGPHGQSYEINGSNEVFTTSSWPRHFQPPTVTISSWIYVKEGSDALIVDNVDTTFQLMGFAFGCYPVSSTVFQPYFQLGLGAAGFVSVQSSVNYPVNVWSFLSASYIPETGYVRFYLNGEFTDDKYVGSVGNNISSNYGGFYNDNLWIGNDSSSLRPLTASLESVTIWNRVLTDAEHSVLYSKPYFYEDVIDDVPIMFHMASSSNTYNELGSGGIKAGGTLKITSNYTYRPAIFATPIAVGHGPNQMFVDSNTNKIYVPNFSGEITTINGNAKKVEGRFNTGTPNYHGAIHYGLNKYYVIVDHQIKVFNLSTNAFIGTITGFDGSSNETTFVVINQTTNTAYVAKNYIATGKIDVVNLNTETLTTSIDVLNKTIGIISIDESSNRLYVQTQNELIVINTSNNQVINSIPYLNLRSVEVDVEKNVLYTLNYDGSNLIFSILDLSNLSTIKSTTINSINIDGSKIGIDSQRERIYLTTSTLRSILILNRQSYNVINDISLVSFGITDSHSLEVNENLGSVYIGRNTTASPEEILILDFGTGVIESGESNLEANYIIISSSNGTVIGGISYVPFSDIIELISAGVYVSGLAIGTVVNNQSVSSIGTIASGNSANSLIASRSWTGGMTITGTSLQVSTSTIIISSSGSNLDGSSISNCIYNFNPTSGINLGGSAINLIYNSDSTTGGAVFNGSANNYIISNYTIGEVASSMEKIYVGGDFTKYNPTIYNRILSLDSDGSFDNTFIIGTGFNEAVNTAAVQNDGKIICGGFFTSYNETNCNRIIRLNTDGSIDNTFSVGTGFNATVWKIVIQTDGKIICSGNFTSYNGTNSNYIIRLNSDGTVDNTFNTGTGFDSQINEIKIQNDGKILCGGLALSYNGTNSSRVARLNSDGSIDNTFTVGTGFNGQVYRITIQNDGKILVGGHFQSYNGSSRNYIARLNSNGTLDNTFTVGTGFSWQVSEIVIQSDNKIIVSGFFSSYNDDPVNRIVRLNTNGSIDNTFDVGAGFDSSANKIIIQGDGKILIGGTFTSYDGVTRNRIIRLNSDWTRDDTFDIGNGFNSEVSDVVIQSNGKPLAVGWFATYNADNYNRLVRLNYDGSLDNTFNIGTGFDGTIYTISIQSDKKVIVGGFYTLYNGTSCGYIVRLNYDGTIDNSFNVGVGFDWAVETTAIQNDGKIIAGGWFTSYNGTNINRIVRLNTDGTIDNTFNIGTGFDNDVKTVAIQSDGKIIAGGLFTSYNGTTSNRIVRLNSDGTTDVTFNIGNGFDYPVYAIAIQSDGKIIVGGNFNFYDDLENNYIIRLNSDGSIDNTFSIGTGFGSTVNIIKIQNDNKILIGGSFGTYDDVEKNYIVRLNSDGSIDSSFIIGTGFDATVYEIEIQSDEKILVGGSFNSYDGTEKNCIVRLDSNATKDDAFITGNAFDGPVLSMALDSSSESSIDFISTGGVQINGSSNEQNIYEEPITGWINANGSNETYIIKEKISGQGGSVLGGESLIPNFLQLSMNGGISLSGQASQQYDIKGQGGSVLGSEAFVTSSQSKTMNDGALLGGQYSQAHEITGEGGTYINGDAFIATNQLIPINGGALLGGEIPKIYDVNGQGGVATNGTANNESVQSDSMSGGIVIGGQYSQAHEITGEGGAYTNGDALVSFDQSLSMEGGVSVGGEDFQTYEPIPEGGAVSGGSANNEIIQETATSGGVLLGGQHGQSYESNQNGGALVGGFGEYYQIMDGYVPPQNAFLGFGGLTINGIAQYSIFQESEIYGGVVLSGKTNTEITASINGGLAASGQAIISEIKAQTISGGLKCSGLTNIQIEYFKLSYLNSNGLNISGDSLIGLQIGISGGILASGYNENFKFNEVIISGGIILNGFIQTQWTYASPNITGFAKLGGKARSENLKLLINNRKSFPLGIEQRGYVEKVEGEIRIPHYVNYCKFGEACVEGYPKIAEITLKIQGNSVPKREKDEPLVNRMITPESPSLES